MYNNIIHYLCWLPVQVISMVAIAWVIGIPVGHAYPATNPPQEPSSYVTTQWTVEEGLPVNAINDIAQTERGYLWLATFDGLVRFDGVRFTVYRSGDYEGLPSSRILAIDADGNDVWLHTESQDLVLFRDGTFHRIDIPDMSMFYRGPDGTLWVGTMEGVFRMENGTAVPVRPAHIRGNVTVIYQTEEGDLWVGTRTQGVYRYQPGGDVYHLAASEGLADAHVNAISSGPNGKVFIATWRGAQYWKNGMLTDVQHQGEPQDEPVFQIETDATGQRWMRTAAGVYRYIDGELIRAFDQVARPTLQPDGSLLHVEPSGGLWVNAVRTLFRNGVPVFETSAEISQLLYDAEGSLWVTTQGKGLFQLRPSQMNIYGAEEGIGNGNVYPILQRQDQSIWIGTLGGGVTQMTPSDTTTFTLRKGTSELENVWSLHETRDGTLWIGSARLCEWDNGACKNPDEEGPIESGRILAIHEDEAGNLWAGTTEGLYRRTPLSEDNLETWFRYVPENSDLPHRIVRGIHEARNGTLWFATNGGGLVGFQDGAFVSFTVDDGLPSNLVRPIYEDAEGRLWIGTEDKGLARIEMPGEGPLDEVLQQATVTSYTVNEGLFDNGIHHIEEDDEGRMWMSTNRGIFWVHTEALNAVARGEQDVVVSTSYTERDGMRNREANGGVQPVGMRDHEGRLWFATQEGAVSIDPSRIQRNTVPPPVQIEQVSTADSTYGVSGDGLKLSAQERNFEITYTALSFANPDKVEFAYKLQGVDSDWRSGTSPRRASYTNIPPGTHTFAVRASNNDGVWNEEGATLQISLTPYFYETWWFWALLFLLAVAGLWGAYRLRVRTLTERKKVLNQEVKARTAEIRSEKEKTQRALSELRDKTRQLEQTNASRTRFFAHVSHEFRTPLTLMLGPIETLLKERAHVLEETERKQLQMAKRSAMRLTQLVDQLHDLAKLETGTMSVEAERANVVSFVAECVTSFSSLARQRNITLTFEDNLEQPIFAFDALKVEEILSNLLTNAFEATENGGMVNVTLRTANACEDPETTSCIAITVKDDGVGIPEDKQPHLRRHFNEHTGAWTLGDSQLGIGLNLVHELAHLHGGKVEFESTSEVGTEFTVYLQNLPVQGSPASDVDLLSSDSQLGNNASDDVSDNGDQASFKKRGLDRHDADPPEDTVPSEVEHEVDDHFDTDSLSTGQNVIADEDESDQTEERRAAKEAEEDQPVVLVIDDDADFRTYVRWHLNTSYRVEEAAGGHAGYEAAKRILPDIVLLDVMMPALDGFELCQKIKNHPDIDHIPVIMLTARVDTKSRIRGLDVGADAYITKPFDTDELTTQIENLLDSRRALQVSFQRDNGSPPAGSEGFSLPQLHTVMQNEPELVERIETAIATHFSDPDFSAAELARAIALSPSHLRRKMKEHYDRTPVQLIRYRRLQAGAQLLNKQPKATIGEIAYAVGFNSQSYFTRSFRDAFDKTPSQFRNDVLNA